MHPPSVAFGPRDVVDVGATAVLAYYLLLLVRGTRAVQIGLGLLVLVVLLGVADLAHLLVLATVLQFLLVGTAVTLPIVFQPELRRALEQIGRGGVFARREPTVEAQSVAGAVAMLAAAAVELARRRTGALVAIELTSGLREFVESGTALDARLSPELLLALFTPASPLHDGAVVVKGTRVEAAGCVLPLSENVFAQSHLGTRHRAALGLTEQTDAVCIVVSEQTGGISVARAGRLSRGIDDEDRLRRVLLACCRSERPRLRPARLIRRGRRDVLGTDAR